MYDTTFNAPKVGWMALNACVFGLEFANLSLNQHNFVNLILIKKKKNELSIT